jgi:hypothetical protein
MRDLPVKPWLGSLISFGVFVFVGWLFERIADPKVLEAAHAMQQSWITVVSALSPVELGETFVVKTVTVLQQILGDWWNVVVHGAPHSHAFSPTMLFMLPLFVLLEIAGEFWQDGKLFVLLQLALGIVAVATFNMVRSNGKRIFFDDNFPSNALLCPLAVIAAASLLAFAFQGVMLASLCALSWITGLAGAAAGATGVVGVCWYCMRKLGEKATEYALTRTINL